MTPTMASVLRKIGEFTPDEARQLEEAWNRGQGLAYDAGVAAERERLMPTIADLKLQIDFAAADLGAVRERHAKLVAAAREVCTAWKPVADPSNDKVFDSMVVLEHRVAALHVLLAEEKKL